MLKIIVPVMLTLLPLVGLADEIAAPGQPVTDESALSSEAQPAASQTGSHEPIVTPATGNASAEPTAPQPKSDNGAITIEWGASSASPTSPRSPLIAVSAAPPLPRRSPKARPNPVVWKTDTEWISAGVGVSTYGASANMTIATLRWPNMYWDTVRFFGGAWKRTVHFFGSSMVGMPFWASARHEFRIGAGICVGYLRFRKPVAEDDSSFSGSGITAAKVKTYVSLPLEAKYIFHLKRRLAFELSTLIAFPMNYRIVFESHREVDPKDYDADYRPFFMAGAGMRF